MALTGRNEAYYQRLPRAAAGADLGAALGLPLPGPVVPLAATSARGTPASISPPSSFVLYLENHDQVANSLARRAARDADVAGPPAGDDRAHAAGAGDADAVPGAGVRRRRSRSSTSPITTASWRGRAPGARASSSTQFPSLADAGGQAALAPPGAPETFARCKLDRTPGAPARVAGAASRSARAAPRAIRRSRSNARIAWHGAVLGAAGARRCASAAMTAAGPRSAAAREPGDAICACRRSPSRCSRRRAGAAGGRLWSSEAIALRRPRRRRRSTPTTAGCCRASPRWSWPRGRQAEDAA